MSNTCINCGCEDAYTSQPACPSPEACPNPQPCAEVFDAQCVSHTLPDILCGVNIVVAQDSNISTALESIVEYMCQSIKNLTACCNSNTIAILQINDEIIQINVDIADVSAYADTLVQSVTGLNTDNTDPRNPIVRVSVDGSTITGTGIPGDPLVATGGGGGIAGSGLNNYVARWTPNNTTLGYGVIEDDGSTLGIGIAPNPNYKVFVSGDVGGGIWAQVTAGSNDAIGVAGKALIVGGTHPSGNRGVVGQGLSSAVLNVGVEGTAGGNNTTLNIGGKFTANNGVTTIGIYASASPATNRYAAQLKDNTEGIGKVLTCMTTDGKANWAQITKANITDGVSGINGTNNYITKWTPDGTTLGDSLIRDDGTRIGINASLQVNAFLFIQGRSDTLTALKVKSFYTASGARGLECDVSEINTFSNTGIYSLARNSASSNIGGHFAADDNGQGGNNYAVKLTDGSQGFGKVLTDVTGNGEANWADLPDPRPYVSYTVIVTQAGVAAPTVNILENTLSEIPTLSYDGVGSYSINTVGAVFTNSKTFIMCNQNDLHLDHRTIAKYGSANTVQLKSTVGTVATDSIFSSCTLEIRVYN